MEYWCPKDGAPRDPAWWHPLQQLAALVAGDGTLPLVLPCEFTFIGRLDRRGAPSIWEYEHKATRRGVQIDEQLRTYRYVPPRDVESVRRGRYLRRRGGIRETVNQLDLDACDWPRDEASFCAGCRNLIAVRRGNPELLAEVIPLAAIRRLRNAG